LQAYLKLIYSRGKDFRLGKTQHRSCGGVNKKEEAITYYIRSSKNQAANILFIKNND
jgi:hypothetical protein